MDKPCLRADAERNHRAIIAAAGGLFAEQGLDGPLDEIARRAGIGNATLYRHFATRADLVAAVFRERMEEHVAMIEEAVAVADPWDGLCAYVTAVTAVQAVDRGIADLITLDISSTPAIAGLRVRARRGVNQLVERCRDAGVVRPDLTAEDVLLVLTANAGLVRAMPLVAPVASARLVHLVLDGLRPEGATPGPPPPSPRRLKAALRQRSRSGRRAPPVRP
jgi:AcrR family transcriptional regulator